MILNNLKYVLTIFKNVMTYISIIFLLKAYLNRKIIFSNVCEKNISNGSVRAQQETDYASNLIMMEV